MENNEITNTTTTTAVADGTAPLTPEQLVEQLRRLREHIPDFGVMTVPAAQSLRRTAAVNDQFTQAAINIVGASSSIAAAIGSTSEALRGERDDISRWRAVEDELRAMLEGVASSNLSRRHRLGLATLQVYSIARQLARQREHADLLPHVENMRRMNKFGRRRRARTQEPPPGPVPVPDPTTTQ